MGREVDKAASRTIGPAGEAEGAAGLDSKIDRRPQRIERVVRPGTDLGVRQTVPEDAPPNKQVLNLHSRPESRELCTSTSTYRPYWAGEVPLQP
jgi:hypothetical protein